jgi:hypothetical protein
MRKEKIESVHHIANQPPRREHRRLTRRSFMSGLSAAGLGVLSVSQLGCSAGVDSGGGPTLENDALLLHFDGKTGLMTRIENKLTNESLVVRGDEFEVEAEEFTLTVHDTRLESLRQTSPEVVEASYRDGGRTVTAVYKLGAKNHFFEKHVVLTSGTPFGLKNLVLGRYALGGANLSVVKYAWLHNSVYFGRFERGGIFLGVELPFDSSSLDSSGVVSLGYAPSLKVKAKERLMSEPIYWGVYKKEPNDAELPHLVAGETQMSEKFYKREFGATLSPHFPLRSESAAMVAMTSAILGPRRERVHAFMDGWDSEMTRAPYQTHEQMQGEMRSIDFAAECGMSYTQSNSIWGGDVPAVNALRDGEKLRLSEMALKVAEYAREKGVGWQLWLCVTNTNPWDGSRWIGDGNLPIPPAQPYRPDLPSWLMSPTRNGKKILHGNCFANRPFFEWLYETHVEALDAGKFSMWMVDGDFFGGGGLVERVKCASPNHDHLPGDSNYVCERNLVELSRRLRKKYPDLYMLFERPAMDLGVWMMRYVDVSFPENEYGKPISLPGVGSQPVNVTLGDQIRTWSRIRVQMQFLPHYLDQPLAFPFPKAEDPKRGIAWESEGVDYTMLSVLACSPNSEYYLPSKSGIPAHDKQTIKKWLDWGQQNIRYLMVRKDLPDWPGAGKVDGFAHVIKDRGFIFLFNPNLKMLEGSFHLDQSVGLTEGQTYTVSSVHPAKVVKNAVTHGEQVTWEVPAQGVVLLEVKPANNTLG